MARLMQTHLRQLHPFTASSAHMAIMQTHLITQGPLRVKKLNNITYKIYFI